MSETLSRLGHLPPRPPTPPKDTTTFTDTTAHTAEPDLPSISHRPSLQSRNASSDSPNSSQEAQRGASGTRSKKVGFLVGPGGATPIATSSPEALAACSINRPTSVSRLPKSILKAAHPPSDTPDHTMPNDDPKDFPRLLDDMTRNLTNTDLSSRLDQYTILNLCLKTYKDQPALQALQEKMPLLADFIQRDISLGKTADSVRNTQIATEVIRLLTTLLWSPTMGETLPGSLQTFIMDEAIAAIGKSETPKSLVNQYLHMLAIQNFRVNIMTSERANRLITNLVTIAERTPGKQVVAHRLTVFRRLIGQVRSVMLARIGDWVEHVFHGMMSETKEIRVRAISLGLDTGAALGAEPAMSKAVKELFRRPSRTEASETRYGDMFIGRLTAWLDSKEDARLVPQIWGAVVLLFRHTRGHFEKWSFTVQWLKLIQRCFNASDPDIKIQANRAWMRFVYVVSPDQDTGPNMVALLRDPIKAQLDRTKISDKDSRRVRLSTHSAYFALMYYAFRPGLDSATLNRHWESYIEKIVSSPTVLDIDRTLICNVLLALLGGTPQRPWSMDRTLSHEQIKLEEVPRLDPKWVRKNSASVLRVIEKIVMIDSWWTSDDDQAPAVCVWQAFCKTLNLASSKEIKICLEAMNAVANITGSLSRYYVNNTRTKAQPTILTPTQAAALKRTTMLFRTSVATLGNIIFAERRLVKGEQFSYQAAETPSTRAAKPQGLLSSATGHLLELLATTTPNECATIELEALATEVVSTLLGTTSSRRSKLRALRLAVPHALDRNEEVKANNVLSAQATLWKVIVTQAIVSIHEQTKEQASNDGSQHIGHDFREAVKILEAGCVIGNFDMLLDWLQLLKAANMQIRQEAGLDAPAVVLIEPLAEALLEQSRSSNVALFPAMTASLVSVTTWPTAPGNVERSHRALWGATYGPLHKSLGAAHFSNLCELLNETSSHMFKKTSTADAAMQEGIFAAVSTFLDSVPRASYQTLLKAIQTFFISYLDDSQEQLTTSSTHSRQAFKAAWQLWKKTLSVVEVIEVSEQAILDSLQHLIEAGLASRHLAFANLTISYWNNTIGLAPDLTCSDKLKSVLYRLSHSAEILLQGLALEPDDSQATPIKYYDTPADLEHTDSQQQAMVVGRKAVRQLTPESKVIPLLQENQETPLRPQKSARKDNPRLRHDDSQIQFAAIDSSPSKLESQLLTEHQREVKERQEREANAMFADLRSSSKAKSQKADGSQPRLQLSSERVMEHSDIDEMQSPTLPQQDNTTFLGSSPTPRERRSMSRDPSSTRPSSSSARSDRRIPDIFQIPSSPPLVPAIVPEASNLAQAANDIRLKLACAVEDEKTAKTRKTSSRVSRSKVADFVANKQAPATTNDVPSSDIKSDDFADLSAAMNIERNTDGVEGNLSQNQRAAIDERQSCSTSTTDSAAEAENLDPVHMQIQIDMERACSQSQEAVLSQVSTPSSSDQSGKRGRKRKSSSAAKPATKRRGRGRPSKTDVQQEESSSSSSSSSSDKLPAERKEDTKPAGDAEDVLDVIVVEEPEATGVTTRSRASKRRRSADIEETSSKSQNLPAAKKTRVLRRSKSDTDLIIDDSDIPGFKLPIPHQVESKETEKKADKQSLVDGMDEQSEGVTLSETSAAPVDPTEEEIQTPTDVQTPTEIATPDAEVPESLDLRQVHNAGIDVLAQARALLASVKATRLGAISDQVMLTCMEVCQTIIASKNKD
jgi:hypothetical protein